VSDRGFRDYIDDEFSLGFIYFLFFFFPFSQIPLCPIWGDIVQSFITKNAVQLE